MGLALTSPAGRDLAPTPGAWQKQRVWDTQGEGDSWQGRVPASEGVPVRGYPGLSSHMRDEAPLPAMCVEMKGFKFPSGSQGPLRPPDSWSPNLRPPPSPCSSTCCRVSGRPCGCNPSQPGSPRALEKGSTRWFAEPVERQRLQMSPSQQEDLPSPATPAPDLNAVLQTPLYKDAAPCVGVRHLPGTSPVQEGCSLLFERGTR